MLARLTRKWRWRAATLLVALYALCAVAPVAAFAISDGGITAQCLTDNRQAVSESPHRQDGATRQHLGPAADEHGSLTKCCGLFCVTAIAPSFDLVSTPIVQTSDVATLAAKSLFGHGSSRIDRPPRSLLSL